MYRMLSNTENGSAFSTVPLGTIWNIVLIIVLINIMVFREFHKADTFLLIMQTHDADWLSTHMVQGLHLRLRYEYEKQMISSENMHITDTRISWI